MESHVILAATGSLAVCLNLLLAAFLLVARGPLRKANRFLAGFLWLTAVDLAGWAAAPLPAAVRDALVFRLPLGFLQMPMLYAYSVALCFPERRLRGHLFVGGAAVATSALSLLPRAMAWYTGTAGGWGGREVDLAINSAALHVQFYVYAGLMALLLAQYRRAYRENRSNPDTRIFTWLATVLGVSLTAHSLVLLKSLLWAAGQSRALTILDVLVSVVAVAITCAMTLAALLKQSLFLGGLDETERVAVPDHDVGATTPEGAIVIERVTSYMTSREPFLDPSLTIRSLARRLGMGQRELSSLINQRMGVHFFDFVNRYRVEKAAALLVDPAAGELNVLEIAHRVGFNSKSSFNAAFGKHAGTTPSAYRRRVTGRLVSDLERSAT